MAPHHLIVLQNGLHGFSFMMSPVKAYLESHLEQADQYKIVISNVNDFHKTWGGISLNGQRLAQFVSSYLDQGQYTHISFIGHSLGGLLIRNCIGLLYQNNYFERIKPMLLATVVTPHLGIGLSSPIKKFLGQYLGTTGRELSLKDTTLEDLSRPDTIYGQALHKFYYLVAYGNVDGDTSTPLSTSCICPPLKSTFIEPHKLYEIKPDIDCLECSFDSKTQSVYDQLNQYPWIRKIINLSDYWNVHCVIINRGFTTQTTVLEDIVKYLTYRLSC